MRRAQIGAIRKCLMLPGFEFDSPHSPPKNGVNSCVFLKSLISADLFSKLPEFGQLYPTISFNSYTDFTLFMK